MDSIHAPTDEKPISDLEELLLPFREAERPPSEWLIGAEAEKFGVDATTGAPLTYQGERGVLRIFQELQDAHGWIADREHPDGPVIALKRERAWITLEPGAQLELSGAPFSSVHAIQGEMRGHLNELRAISSEMNLIWLAVGFHPLARQEDLPWVPKDRYPIMREFLPKKGPGGLDMMRRTATVQANFDYSSEADALAKLSTLLRLAPILNAMTANSPFKEGRLSGKKSLRQEVWLNMDPSRSGLIPRLWEDRPLGYRDYAEWALDAGMFFFRREGKIVHNTGQTFRDFWANGFQGHRAMLSDWRQHLTTLFPEIRLKRTLEVRCCDSLPLSLAFALPALVAGLIYDSQALERLRELLGPLSFEAVTAARPALVQQGLGASIGGQSVRTLAEQVLDIATGGLNRRGKLNAQGQDESIYLRRLAELVGQGKSPADVLTEGLRDDDPDLRVEMLSRSQM